MVDKGWTNHMIQSNQIIKVSLFRPLGMFIATVFSIASIQWLCQQFLAHWCHRSGFWGFVSNALSLGSPVCLAANNISAGLANHYISIWSGAATFCLTWIISNIVSPVPKNI